MYLNIASFTAHKQELNWVVNQWKPAIICLVETRITVDLEDREIQIEGYTSVHALSVSRHTGGASIYIKSELHYGSVLRVVLEKNMWLIGINLAINGQRFNILNTYHSPSAADGEFVDKLDEILCEYATKPGTLILTGDFNIDLSKQSFYAQKLDNIIKRNGLYQIVQGFTRVTQNSATMIDLVITNEKQLDHIIHFTPKIADHSIITIEFPTLIVKTQTQAYRDIKNFNEIQFQVDLMNYRWTTNLKTTSEKANYLVQIITEQLDQHAPVRERTVQSQWGNRGWWTPQIKQEIIERDKLYKRAVITKDDDDWRAYREQRNRVVEVLRGQRQSYYHQKIDVVKGDSREMWKCLKDIIGKNKTRKIKDGVVFDGQLEKEETKIAERFNDYFLDSVNDLARDVCAAEAEGVLNNIETSEDKFDEFKQLELRELRKIVKNLKNKNSSVDGINVKVLKLAFEVIGDKFLQVINSSLENGSFPAQWKLSTVIPIEKVINTNKCEEHRPINMVPIYEKLLETVVNGQVREYVEKNKLLTHYQAGFRRKHSCESALQTVLAKWKTATSRKKLVGIVFLDFRRAFETINRGLLILKLRKYGFGGNVLRWLSEYLEDRTQQTRYSSATSSIKNSKHGVPQGTVLGPDLFVLYINDMVRVVNQCELQLFADDTVLFYEGDSVDDIIQTMNGDLDRLNKWLCNNSLNVNIKKTKYMILKSKHKNLDTYSHRDLIIDNNKIEQVIEYKYLGVLIDENLTFSNHASYVTKKISKKVNYVCRMGRDLSSWSKLLVYKTIILPHFSYCATILYMFSKGETDVLQKKQNRILRCILGCSRYTRIKDMLKTTNLLSVRQTIYFNTMIVIFKIKNDMYPQHIIDRIQLVSDIHNYDTRTRLDFYVPLENSAFVRNSLFHRGLIDFNDLPMHIKSANFYNFKKMLREYILDNYDI